MNTEVCRETVLDALDVSRETSADLDAYAALLLKWNPAINLVAPATLDDLWQRHILDSAQLLEVEDAHSGLWVDLGSGGGLPGLVVAILAREKAPRLHVTCIESDLRKAAFLRTVAREIGLSVGVLSRRIEETPPQRAQYLSARALAPLPKLLEHAARHLAPDGRAIFPKGKSWREEVEASLANWRFAMETYPSKTTRDSMILSIGGIERV